MQANGRGRGNARDVDRQHLERIAEERFTSLDIQVDREVDREDLAVALLGGFARRMALLDDEPAPLELTVMPSVAEWVEAPYPKAAEEAGLYRDALGCAPPAGRRG